MKLVKHSLLSLILATGFAAGSALAQDQGAEPPAMPQQQAAPQMDVSDKQVESFADAYLAVQGVGQQYRSKMQTAADDAEKQELQQSAQGEMQTAIKDSGLTLDKYKKIAQAANQDEELRQRISAAITELAKPQAEQESES